MAGPRGTRPRPRGGVASRHPPPPPTHTRTHARGCVASKHTHTHNTHTHTHTHTRTQGNKIRRLRRATMNAWRGGFINIKDMYNNDGGQGGAPRGCEAHEGK